MTIYEHAMVGINGALALGLARRHGWQIVALAGFAALVPDFDGLTILLGPQCYAEGHRFWAHNLLVAGLAAAIVSAAAYYTDAFTRIQRWLAKHGWGGSPHGRDGSCADGSDGTDGWGGSCTATPESPSAAGAAVQLPPQHLPVQLPLRRSGTELALWIAVGVIAAYSHLLMDIAFSAGRDLPIWGVPLFWPFSSTAYAYPLVRWGDIGATVIFAASMFAMLRWPARVRTIAAASLIAVAAYIVARGFSV
jgi:membrane-bound metal-dependent hydrolase YbcI (DUF457 family)